MSGIRSTTSFSDLTAVGGISYNYFVKPTDGNKEAPAIEPVLS